MLLTAPGCGDAAEIGVGLEPVVFVAFEATALVGAAGEPLKFPFGSLPGAMAETLFPAFGCRALVLMVDLAAVGLLLVLLAKGVLVGVLLLGAVRGVVDVTRPAAT